MEKKNSIVHCIINHTKYKNNHLLLSPGKPSTDKENVTRIMIDFLFFFSSKYHSDKTFIFKYVLIYLYFLEMYSIICMCINFKK